MRCSRRQIPGSRDDEHDNDRDDYGGPRHRSEPVHANLEGVRFKGNTARVYEGTLIAPSFEFLERQSLAPAEKRPAAGARALRDPRRRGHRSTDLVTRPRIQSWRVR